MDWRDVGAYGILALSVWLFVSAMVLPRWIGNTRWVITIVLIGAFAIHWGFEFIAPKSMLIREVSTVVIIVVALLAGLYCEVLERRRTGRWRFLDPGERKQ